MKSSGVKTSTTFREVVEQDGKMPSVNGKGDVQPRIAQRAYDLYHRRGGPHGQDLEDWFLAEQEILAEDAGANVEPP